MQQGASRAGGGNMPPRSRTVALAAGLAAVLALAACTSRTAAGGTSDSPVAHATPVTTTAPDGSVTTSTPAPQPAVITSSPSAGATAFSPADRVKVSIANGRLTGVTMLNPAGKAVAGALAADGTSWQSAEDLGYAKTYSVVASGVDTAGNPITKREHVTTVTPDNLTMPYLEDIYGSMLKSGATYGVGMVVRLHFDESVNRTLAERALHVTTTPAVTGGWFWDDNQNVYWRPQHYFAPGTTVRVSAQVYGTRVGPGLYGQADQSISFKIGAKHYSVADARTHKVKVYFDDKLVRTMPTSMGRGGTVQGKNGPIYLWTMPGIYTVINHENPAIMSSDSYGLPANSPAGYAPEKVYWSTKISTDGIYLHELDTTVWAQGHQNISHGCLNLNYTNAHWFYLHSVVGDVVQVVHSGGPKLQFWQGGQWSVPWSTWVKGSALS
jgi:lipoprotein-anchoring transpeptidase ErfK/SrfK